MRVVLHTHRNLCRLNVRTAQSSTSPPPAGRSVKRFAPSTRTLPVRGDRRCEMPRVHVSRQPAERFWEKVNRSAGEGACWPWMASIYKRTGYGRFALTHKRMTGAHRASWMFTHGSIPDGLCVLHTCDNRRCVNPSHLWLGTNDENMADMVAKKRSPTGLRNGKYTKPWRTPRGESNGRSKLTSFIIEEIRASLDAGTSTQRQLATRFGVAQSMIWAIWHRRAWAHVGRNLGVLDACGIERPQEHR